MPQEATSFAEFNRRVLVVVAWAALALVGIYFLGHLIDVLLMAFSGVLVAVALDGFTRLLQRRTPLSRPWALLSASALVVLMVTGAAMLIGPQVADQVPELMRQLPRAAGEVLEMLEGLPGFEAARDMAENEEGMPGVERLADIGQSIFSTTLTMLTAAVVIPLIAIYLVIDPGAYVEQFLMLLPVRKRDRARDVFAQLGSALRLWMLSRLISMVFVGVATAAGLWLLDAPLPFALGLTAGLLTFIPFLGPVLAAIPTVLIALMESASLALYAGLLYAAVEQIESSVVQPLAQKGVVHLPPAYTVGIQLAGGSVAGIAGVILATPLAVAGAVIVQMLYVEDVLHEDVDVIGG